MPKSELDADRAKRKYREKVRMAVKNWEYWGACQVVKEWLGGTEEDEYLEYTTLWKWLEIRCAKEEKMAKDFLTTKGGVRLTLEYLRRVHDDQMADHTVKNLREKCAVKMDDYLMWSESEIAAFVFRCENLIEADRMERQAHVVRKQMVEGIKTGDNKKIQQWLEMTGRSKGEMKDKEGFTMQVVEKYHVGGEDKVVQIPKDKMG